MCTSQLLCIYASYLGSYVYSGGLQLQFLLPQILQLAMPPTISAPDHDVAAAPITLPAPRTDKPYPIISIPN